VVAVIIVAVVAVLLVLAIGVADYFDRYRSRELTVEAAERDLASARSALTTGGSPLTTLLAWRRLQRVRRRSS